MIGRVALPRPVEHLAASLLTLPVARYITKQRDRLSPSAAPLAAAIKDPLIPFFTPADLDRVVLLEADPLPIPNPPFEQQVRSLGFDFPSVALVAAITFDYLIVARAPISPELLFHELVHVVQYRILGVRRFARLYVGGFLASGDYAGIPLERCAFALEHRYVNGRSAFSVEDEISAQAANGLL